MKKQLTLAVALTGILAAGSVNALTIDTYDGTGPFTLDAPQTNAAVGSSSAGKARTLTSTTSGASTNVQIDTVTNVGVYAHSQSSGVTGTSGITYDLTGVDLTQADPLSGLPSNAFRIQLASADLSGLLFMTVGTVTQTLSTTAIILAAGGLPAYADFLYSSFAGSGFNFLTGGFVTLGVNGSATAALDVSIDAFTTVCSTLPENGGAGGSVSGNRCAQTPVPGALWLMGVGLGALGIVTRRRRANV